MAVIFYLSGTGNSLYVAKQVRTAWPDCRLEKIGDYLKHPYQVTDKIVGIICPVYCFALPPVMVDFVRALQAGPDYCFGLVTMGANAGFALKQLRGLLQKQQITLQYAQDIAMPDNFFAVPEFMRRKLLEAAEGKLAAVRQQLQRQQQDVSRCKDVFFWEHGGTAIGWKFMHGFLKMDALQADNAKCIGCGICARICPMQNIVMQSDKPVFGANCAHCLGCLHWCPQTAIKAGRKTVTKKSRYVNPYISAEEMNEVEN